MDATDRAIIEVLRVDGRISNVALADRVNLTPGPCLRRVQRLEADRVVVGYRAELDPDAVGQGFEVFLDVDLTSFDSGSVGRFESAMADRQEVIELHRMFGSPDYIVRIAVADRAEYEAFLTERVLTIPGILKVASRFPMKTLKSLRSTVRRGRD
ncbi:Lrp/AsnC family transcriptional regulator [Agromyces sp. SYSU K20354]|uniref:Lrp/AsnC family transcriptional regulator n=1 Tax=Agromyces cavernae TaxID=2898659 RepID=UPI001E536DE7|nr:Lrp/AsnC family transcriptional regulator [Agromyces cavernae]MCD2443156.1 Lrp/AsnC family transcriptional regulator [Agromyces cavernae]